MDSSYSCPVSRSRISYDPEDDPKFQPQVIICQKEMIAEIVKLSFEEGYTPYKQESHEYKQLVILYFKPLEK